MSSFEELQEKIADFVQERDWEQFHAPKNLSMAISVESSELMEHFQWLDAEASRSIEDEKKLEEIRQEIADIMIFSLNFCNQMDIDPAQAIEEKLQINKEKYPVEDAKGKAEKYTELKDTDE